jgi:hypothetical protein
VVRTHTQSIIAHLLANFGQSARRDLQEEAGAPMSASGTCRARPEKTNQGV